MEKRDKNDIQNESTELGSLLCDLTNMVQAYANTPFNVGRAHLAQVIAMTATFANLKVTKMMSRWEIHLPFHEAMEVNFEQAAEDVEKCIEVLESASQKRPSSRFMQDLYGTVQEGKPYYAPNKEKTIEEDENDFCTRLEKMFSTMDKTYDQWIPKLEVHVLEEMGVHGVAFSTTGGLQEILLNLKNTLQQTHDMFSKAKDEDVLHRYGIRVVRHYCPAKHIKKIEAEIEQLINSTGKKNKKERLQEHKEKLLQKIQEMNLPTKYKLEDYVTPDMPLVNEDSGFGQYLFVNRRKLTTDNVKMLYCTMRQIYLLNEALGVKRPKPTKRELDEQEQQIWSQIVTMCDKTNWQNGYTSRQVKDGLKMALGMSSNAPLTDKEKELSELLWRQFKRRTANDPDKSFSITWLSFVGWCIRVAIIEGGHAPELCQSYFPRHRAEYPAIDKGRKGEVKSFEDLTPLLSRCVIGKVM